MHRAEPLGRSQLEMVVREQEAAFWWSLCCLPPCSTFLSKHNIPESHLLWEGPGMAPSVLVPSLLNRERVPLAGCSIYLLRHTLNAHMRFLVLFKRVSLGPG